MDGTTRPTLDEFLTAQGYVPVPLTCNAVGHFEIAAASIDGHEVRLLLDTGASHTVVDHASAERLGLASEASSRRGGGVGGAEQAVTAGTLGRLDVGPTAFRDVPVFVMDLGHVSRALESQGGSAIDGAVGGDLMRPSEAVIDYARSTLYLRVPTPPSGA
jgi:clan AA aspartic protease (TIGR02281 family)